MSSHDVATGSGARPRRSCLAVPASNERMIEKAAQLPVDHVFFDLEDATVPEEKAGARTKVVDALNALDFGARTVAIRMNDVRTRFAYRDVVEVVSGAGRHLDCVIIPKVQHASDVHFVDHLLSGLERELGLEHRIGIEVLIETTQGAVELREIVRASTRTEALIFGPGDYSLDLGVLRFEIGTADARYPGHQWHWVMCEIANHARAAGIQAIDGPCVDFGDEEGYMALALSAKLLGFEGKWCIHPNQIPWANAAFTVSESEIVRARSVLEAYAASRANGHGAAVFDGIMIDDATRKIAELILERAGSSRGGEQE